MRMRRDLVETPYGFIHYRHTGEHHERTVVVSHIKYSLTDEQPQEAICKELEAGNDLGVQFVIPEQGALYHFQ